MYAAKVRLSSFRFLCASQTDLGNFSVLIFMKNLTNILAADATSQTDVRTCFPLKAPHAL
jgi:hypothetical protein